MLYFSKPISILATRAHHRFSSQKEEISEPHFSQSEILPQYSKNKAFSEPYTTLSAGKLDIILQFLLLIFCIYVIAVLPHFSSSM